MGIQDLKAFQAIQEFLDTVAYQENLGGKAGTSQYADAIIAKMKKN